MFEPAIKHISSGNYHVSSRSKMVLRAVLGTCVGVAIYDEINTVGGLIHLLLASPPSSHMSSNPIRYASTGLPEFIKALEDAGASKTHMKATIAGGALIGPVTEQDLFLNIGGETAETVKAILLKENISIEKSETGGFFACNLNLNLFQMETVIEPAGTEQLCTSVPAKSANKQAIDRAIEELAPIPQVAIKLLKAADHNQNISDIALEVRKDQVLSARTLQLCNCALFARRNPVLSLEEALIFMGKNLFVQLILSAAVKNYFKPDVSGYSICKGGLYHHAVGTAHMADKLAAFAGYEKPAAAYIAGLLHDIGKVVLDQFISMAYPHLYRNTSDKELNMIEVEQEIFGADHTEVGRRLAERWELPVSIADTIAHHHQPEKSTADPVLTHIVYLADLLMYRFNSGLEIERLETGGLYRSLEIIGLSDSLFPQLVDMISGHVLAGPDAGSY
jgi:putative nucleotidyltransferase with HDIG domain